MDSPALWHLFCGRRYRVIRTLVEDHLAKVEVADERGRTLRFSLEGWKMRARRIAP